jgi:hydroxymethylbilane synthase
MGTVGIFTREVDNAVLDGRAHAAVHSLKDVPTTPPAGLRVAAVLEREDPRDALIVAPGLPRNLADLPPASRVGTSSLRRKALLLSQRRDLRVDDLRGNLDTRIARVVSGDYHAAVMALAGIRRLERTDVVAEILEGPGWLPAPGQGAIAVVVAERDIVSGDLVATIDHPPTRAATSAERAFLSALQGGCQVPIGALARLDRDTLTLDGFVASLNGAIYLNGTDNGAATQPDRCWPARAPLQQRRWRNPERAPALRQGAAGSRAPCQLWPATLQQAGIHKWRF